MKRILNAIYSANEWLNETDKRHTIFLYVLVASFTASLGIDMLLDRWIIYPSVWFIYILFRGIYILEFKNRKKKFVFDIETGGLHEGESTLIVAYKDVLKDAEPKVIETGKFDHQSVAEMAKRFGIEDTKPTLVDTFKIIKDKEDKNQ